VVALVFPSLDCCGQPSDGRRQGDEVAVVHLAAVQLTGQLVE